MNRPATDSLALHDREDLKAEHPVTPSDKRQRLRGNAIVQNYEDKLFKSDDILEVQGIVNKIRTSMIEDSLTGEDLIILGQILVRGERKASVLSGGKPDAPAYLDMASSDSPSQNEPTDEMLQEVERLNTQRSRENNSQRFQLDMMRLGIPVQALEAHVSAHNSKGTEFPDEGAIRSEIAADVNAIPVRNIHGAV